MRKVIAWELVSLDGVMEKPEEWSFSYSNDEMAEANASGMADSDAVRAARKGNLRRVRRFLALPEQRRAAVHRLPEQHRQVRRLDDPPRAPRVAELDAHQG